MAKLTIKKDGDPILRQKAAKIKDPLAKEIRELALAMLEFMRENNGVGLAAPQVGHSIRLCTIEVDGDSFVLINPKITAKSRKRETCEEGCLSFPGQFYLIPRSEEVQVRFTDENGNSRKVKSKGLLARAFQHEIDHLDGILFIDKLKKKNN